MPFNYIKFYHISQLLSIFLFNYISNFMYFCLKELISINFDWIFIIQTVFINLFLKNITEPKPIISYKY